MKSSNSDSVTFVGMSLDRPTRSVRLLQRDRTSEDRLRDKLASIFKYEISINFVLNFRENKAILHILQVHVLKQK